MNTHLPQQTPSEHSSSIPTKPSAPIHKPVLKVIGLGGGGSNAVNRMIEFGIKGVDFIAANTDKQALQQSLAPIKVQLGPVSTRGLGAGGNPEVGTTASEESWRKLATVLHGADMVFLTAGMGGGTGTGSIPVVAKIARSLGAVTIAIVTTPFSFEMGRRQKNAQQGIEKLRQNTDTLIAIPNDRLLNVASKSLTIDLAFRMADDVLRQAIQGISELITNPGMINVDFANIRNLMKLGGGALMSIGQGEGEDKAKNAIDKALNHPLLEATSLSSAAGILVNFTSGDDLTLFEIDKALTYLQNESGSKAEIVMGVNYDERLAGKVEVILVVTGIGAVTLEETLPGFSVNREDKHKTNIENEMKEIKPRTNGLHERQPLKKDQVLIPSGLANDLDVPAFLRKS